MEAKVTIDVRGMPALVWACRRALADLLRAEAEREASNYVANRLRETAALFETGAKES